MNIKDCITPQELKETMILLEKTKRMYDIDTFLLMKRMLFVGAVINYLQNASHSGSWIPYCKLLERNQQLVNSHADIDMLKRRNGVFSTSYFGVNCKLIKKNTSLQTLEYETIKAYAKYH